MWKPSITSYDVIMHSAKGSTWKNHKYLKKIGNVYVYAKTAYKHFKESDRYKKKKYEAYDNAGVALADSVSTRMGHPDYNFSYGKDDETSYKSAYTFAERATRYRDAQFKHYNIAERYERLAKKELASIQKEMISDGQNLYNSLKSKLFKKKG